MGLDFKDLDQEDRRVKLSKQEFIDLKAFFRDIGFNTQGGSPKARKDSMLG